MESFLKDMSLFNYMKKLFFLLAFAVLIVACSQAKVIDVTNQEPQNTEAQETANSTVSAEPGTGASVSTGGKVPVSCDDSDANDKAELGVVTVTYSDGSVEKFYDDCPGKDIGNDMIETEYICDGNVVKSKNNICNKFEACLLVNVKADPGKKVGFCTG